MKEEVTRILKLVSEGKLSPEDAIELIEAIQQQSGANEAEASQEGGEQAKGKDPFRGFLDFMEGMERDLTQNVDWKGIASQIKEGTQKGIDAIKKAAEDVKVGNINFLFCTESREFDLPVDLSGGKTLKIDNPLGDISVKGGADHSHIVVKAKIRGNTTEEAKEKADQFTVMVEESDHEALLKLARQTGLSVELEVFIAGTAALDVRSDSGAISIDGTGGPVKVTGQSGAVSIRGAAGLMEVSVQSGAISITESQPTMLNIECRSGAISLDKVEGNVNARAASGEVSVTNWKGKTLALESVSGSVNADICDPITGQVTIRTVSGGTNVSIADGCDCRVSLSTIRGAVSLNNVTLEDEVKSDQLVTGRLGAGTGSLEVSGINGSISLTLRNSN